MLSGALLLTLSIALLTALSGPQPVAAEDDYLLIEARIAAHRQEDGRVGVALQLRRGDGGWGRQVIPERRFLPADADLDRWYHTEPLPIDGVPALVRITARRIANGHVELALQRDTSEDGSGGWGERQLPRSRQLDSPRYGPGSLRTSSIDLVDEGPAVCRLGLIVRSAERCRFPDTRGEFVVDADGGARFPVDPSNRYTDNHDGTWPAGRTSLRFVVPSLHGIGLGYPAAGVNAERLEPGVYLITRMELDVLAPVNGADCVEGLLVPFGSYCGLPHTTNSSAWFAVYKDGLAFLSDPGRELRWIDDAELHAETVPAEYRPYYRFDAVREDRGWRINTMIVPEDHASPPAVVEFVDCRPGLILQVGEGCADPTSTHVLWIAADGGLVLDSGAPFYDTVLVGTYGHPYSHGLGVQPLADAAWIVTSLHHHPDNPVRVGSCGVGSLLYPGEACDKWGAGGLRVFRSGFAQVATAGGFERVSLDGYEVVYASGRVANYAVTAERQSDGGFLISGMRERWQELEAQVQRQRGDCFPGLILVAGDGCRYPNSGELVVVSEAGVVGVGVAYTLDADGVHFVPWGDLGWEVVRYQPLRDGQVIIVTIGADTPRPIGECSIDLAVKPGRSCRSGWQLPNFYVFYDAAFYNGVAAHNDLEVDGDDGAPRLRAERQPDRSYIIRELG